VSVGLLNSSFFITITAEGLRGQWIFHCAPRVYCGNVTDSLRCGPEIAVFTPANSLIALENSDVMNFRTDTNYRFALAHRA